MVEFDHARIAPPAINNVGLDLRQHTIGFWAQRERTPTGISCVLRTAREFSYYFAPSLFHSQAAAQPTMNPMPVVTTTSDTARIDSNGSIK